MKRFEDNINRLMEEQANTDRDFCVRDRGIREKDDSKAIFCNTKSVATRFVRLLIDEAKTANIFLYIALYGCQEICSDLDVRIPDGSFRGQFSCNFLNYPPQIEMFIKNMNHEEEGETAPTTNSMFLLEEPWPSTREGVIVAKSQGIEVVIILRDGKQEKSYRFLRFEKDYEQ